ncbi:MAG: CsbD family protein [Alphaproteobacteria bacterium]|nr:CsbD family protein [Alphaproteobacteria bacterium]
MNKDQVKGATKEVAGKTEKAFGDAVDSPKHQIKGAANEAIGKTQKAMGDMKDDAKKQDKEIKKEERRSW